MLAEEGMGKRRRRRRAGKEAGGQAASGVDQRNDYGGKLKFHRGGEGREPAGPAAAQG